MINKLSENAKNKLVCLGLFLAVLIPVTALIKSFTLAKAEGLLAGRVSLDYLYSLGNTYFIAEQFYIFSILGFFTLISFIDFKKLGFPMISIGVLSVFYNYFLKFMQGGREPLESLFLAPYYFITYSILLISFIFLINGLSKVNVKGAKFAKIMTMVTLANIILGAFVYAYTKLWIISYSNSFYFDSITVLDALWILSLVYLGIKKLNTKFAYVLGLIALLAFASTVVLAEDISPANLESLISEKEHYWFAGGGREDSLIKETSLRAIEEKNIKVCADQKFSEDPTLNENYVQNCIYKSLEKLRWKDFEICSVIKDPSLENACASAVMSRYSSSTVCEQIKDTYPEVHQECLARFGLNSEV